MLYVVHLQKMTLTSLGRKTRTNEQIIGRSSGIKHLVSFKVTGAIKNKFQSVVHPHENVVKSAQHH
jgi:hypothetical protein